MWYTFWMTNRWLLLNLDVLGTITVFITMLFSIATLGNDAGIAGLCISTAMGITSAGMDPFMVLGLGELTTAGNSLLCLLLLYKWAKWFIIFGIVLADVSSLDSELDLK